MSEDPGVDALPQCARCGAPYRPPNWGRDYACGACGVALAAAPSRRFTPPVWALYTLPVLLLGGAGVHLLTGRVQARAVEPQRVSRSRRVEIPPQLQAQLRQRVAWLEADLRLEPAHPMLLAITAETYFSLAALTRQEDSAESGRWADLAQQRLSRLREAAPELCETLEIAAAEPERLVWGPPGAGTLVGSSWRTRQDRATRVLLDLAPGVGTSRAMTPPSSVSPGGRAVLGTPTPGVSVPGYPGNAPSYTGNGPGYNPNYGPGGNGPGPAMAGGGLVGELPPPPAMGASGGYPRVTPPAPPYAAGTFEPPVSLSVARARSLAEPQSARAAAEYARTLELIAEAQARIQPQEQSRSAMEPWLIEAAAAYEEASRRARLRTYRAALECAAADVYRRLQDHDRRYAALKRAAGHAPHSVGVWRELQEAAFRSGHVQESRLAWKEARRWNLPSLGLGS